MVNPLHASWIRTATTDLAGILIDGTSEQRYEIDKQEGFISEGSYGKVFKGYDKQHGGRVVAIKLANNSNTSILNLYQRESEILRRHRHNNIVEIYAHHEGRAGKPVLVLEYIPLTLGNILDAEDFSVDNSNGSGLERLIYYLQHVGNAADFLHQIKVGENPETKEPIVVVHRDIKPSNILVSEDSRVVKLSDFGHAGSSGTASSARGTLYYRAPEGFIDDEGRFYPESDIYSIAVITFEAFAKTTPFTGVSASPNVILEFKKQDGYVEGKCQEYGIWDEEKDELSPLGKILVRGMHPDRTKRPHSCQEFIEELKELDKQKKAYIQREKQKQKAQAEFTRLYRELTGLTDKTPDGIYGCTSFYDIEEVYSKYSALLTCAQSNNFTEDPRIKQAVNSLRARRKQDYETLGEKLNELEQGKTAESIRDVIFNVGAVGHCWGHPSCWLPPLPDENFNMADERLSKQQIEDGTYAGHCARGFPKKDKEL